MDYIRAVSPDGWHNVEEPLWAAFVDYVPEMLSFLESRSPLRFTPNNEPDPYAEETGGLERGAERDGRPAAAWDSRRLE